MKKILVTGGCGYLGARISRYFTDLGHKVTVFDKADASAYPGWTAKMEEIITGDIRDVDTVARLTQNFYDAVIHLISLDHHQSENSSLHTVSDINVMPTWHLLDEFTNRGLNQFIYLSTFHVYGKVPMTNITEDQTPAPINTYGLTHLLSENLCNYYHGC